MRILQCRLNVGLSDRQYVWRNNTIHPTEKQESFTLNKVKPHIRHCSVSVTLSTCFREIRVWECRLRNKSRFWGFVVFLSVYIASTVGHDSFLPIHFQLFIILPTFRVLDGLREKLNTLSLVSSKKICLYFTGSSFPLCFDSRFQSLSFRLPIPPVYFFSNDLVSSKLLRSEVLTVVLLKLQVLRHVRQNGLFVDCVALQTKALRFFLNIS